MSEEPTPRLRKISCSLLSLRMQSQSPGKQVEAIRLGEPAARCRFRQGGNINVFVYQDGRRAIKSTLQVFGLFYSLLAFLHIPHVCSTDITSASVLAAGCRNEWADHWIPIGTCKGICIPFYGE